MIVLYEKVKSGTFELNCQLKTYIYSRYVGGVAQRLAAAKVLSRVDKALQKQFLLKKMWTPTDN